MRPRWWYIAIGNCDAKSGEHSSLLYLEYNILMTNADVTNRWFYHFSFDEFCKHFQSKFLNIEDSSLDTLPITIAFMILELILLIVSVVFTCTFVFTKLL